MFGATAMVTFPFSVSMIAFALIFVMFFQGRPKKQQKLISRQNAKEPAKIQKKLFTDA